MDWNMVMGGVGVAIVILTLSWFINSKKMVENIGKIKCKRCGYQGKPKPYGNIFQKISIVCPDCNSGEWEKLTN